jgi:hypothetical protein
VVIRDSWNATAARILVWAVDYCEAAVGRAQTEVSVPLETQLPDQFSKSDTVLVKSAGAHTRPTAGQNKTPTHANTIRFVRLLWKLRMPVGTRGRES